MKGETNILIRSESLSKTYSKKQRGTVIGETMRKLDNKLSKKKARMTLIGMEPTYALDGKIGSKPGQDPFFIKSFSKRQSKVKHNIFIV